MRVPENPESSPANPSDARVARPNATFLRPDSFSTTTTHNLGVSMRPASLNSPMTLETASRVHATMKRVVWIGAPH